MKETIRKWYGILFPDGKYKDEFEALLEGTELKEISFEEYVPADGPYGLLMTLYFCRRLEDIFTAKGVSREILLDTLSDIVLWTDEYERLYGTLGLATADWFRHAHFSGDFFKLGRLQFMVRDSETEVHIPACGSLSPEKCSASFAMAKEFIKKYYPDKAGNPITCDSWLLDGTLRQLLDADSNILAFADRFEIVKSEPSDAALRYVFNWNAVREDVPALEASTKLQKAVKAHVLSGGRLYASRGIVK